LLLLFACLAHAQQRTFVSGSGDDTNACNRTGPCRTIAQAITITNPGGEVIVLDSAGYGPFTVSKSISITAPPGVYAGISVFSGNGVTVNAGASDTVILRGLTINNQGSMGAGINATGGNLQVERCIITGFIDSNDLLFLTGSASLEVKDSIFRGGGCGIAVSPQGSPSTAAIDRVRLEGNETGLCVAAPSQVTVRNSLASGNTAGFFANNSDSSSNSSLYIENCVASGNSGEGVLAFNGGGTGSATIKISNSTVTNNGIGLHVMGSNAIVLSRGNNTVEGNTTSTMGTIGSFVAK